MSRISGLTLIIFFSFLCFSSKLLASYPQEFNPEQTDYKYKFYKIINRWHSERNKPSYLATNLMDNRVYVSDDILGESTIWNIHTVGELGYYTICNRDCLDEGKPAYLNAFPDDPEGRIYLSSYEVDNVLWKIEQTSPKHYYSIANKWHLDRGKPACLDVDSQGHLYRSNHKSHWWLDIIDLALSPHQRSTDKS